MIIASSLLSINKIFFRKSQFSFKNFELTLINYIINLLIT